MRLRKKSREIAQLADIKRECDRIAERHAKRVAMAGGAGLVAWWGVVYELTFRTELGWDVMEPVTVSQPSANPLRDRVIDAPFLVVPRRPVDADWRLRLVPDPQPPGLVPLGHELHHLAAPVTALRTEGL